MSERPLEAAQAPSTGWMLRLSGSPALLRPDGGASLLDRHGALLAADRYFYQVTTTPSHFNSNDERMAVARQLETLAAIPAATLNKVLQYHVVAGANVVSTTLTDNQQVTTFETGKLTVDLDGGAALIDENNRRSRIIATDVQANNGIIHVIDRVVLPN